MNRRSFSHFLGVSYFVHPLPLLAVALLILNDRWLKTHFPSWWTGKLSDFAGLFFFPLFLCGLFNLFKRLFGAKDPWISRRQLLMAIALTDSVFIAIKLNEGVASLYGNTLSGLGFSGSRAVTDPSDLIALVSSVLVYYFARSFWSEATEE